MPRSTRTTGASFLVTASAADLRHRTVGANEIDLADVVSRPLRANRALDRGGEPVVEVGRVAPQDRTEVGFVEGEQTGAELALGCQPDAVTVLAERLGDARDHADVADTVAVTEL